MRINKIYRAKLLEDKSRFPEVYRLGLHVYKSFDFNRLLGEDGLSDSFLNSLNLVGKFGCEKVYHFVIQDKNKIVAASMLFIIKGEYNHRLVAYYGKNFVLDKYKIIGLSTLLHKVKIDFLKRHYQEIDLVVSVGLERDSQVLLEEGFNHEKEEILSGPIAVNGFAFIKPKYLFLYKHLNEKTEIEAEQKELTKKLKLLSRPRLCLHNKLKRIRKSEKEKELIIADYLTGTSSYRKLGIRQEIDYRMIRSWVTKYHGKLIKAKKMRFYPKHK
jgi:hypothetical protein